MRSIVLFPLWLLAIAAVFLHGHALADSSGVPASRQAAVAGDNDKRPADKKPGDKTAANKTANDTTADDSKSADKPHAAKSGNRNNRAGALTAAREAAALAFVQENHRELSPLLSSLKSANPAEYKIAISDLFRASERLAIVKERDPRRHELELKTWKLDSRIKLLAVRLAMSSDPSLETELKELLKQRIETRRSMLEEERAKVLSRLEKLEAQIKALGEDPNQRANDELVEMMHKLKPNVKSKKPSTARDAAGVGRRTLEVTIEPK